MMVQCNMICIKYHGKLCKTCQNLVHDLWEGSRTSEKYEMTDNFFFTQLSLKFWKCIKSSLRVSQGCQLHGDARSQGISTHGIDHVPSVLSLKWLIFKINLPINSPSLVRHNVGHFHPLSNRNSHNKMSSFSPDVNLLSRRIPPEEDTDKYSAVPL